MVGCRIIAMNSAARAAPLIPAGELNVPGKNSDLSFSEDQSAFFFMLSSFSVNSTRRPGTRSRRCRVNKADCNLRVAEGCYAQ